MSRNLRIVCGTISVAISAIATTDAFAAQGPGIAAGTATAFTQIAVAIVVYGLSAVIIVAGLVGGLRRH